MAGERPQDRARQQEQQRQADRLNQARQREKAAKSGDRAGATFPGIDGQLDLLRTLEKQQQKTKTASEAGGRKTRSGEGHDAGSLKAEHQKRGRSSDAVAGSSNLLRRLGDALRDTGSKSSANQDHNQAVSEAGTSRAGGTELLKQLGASPEQGAGSTGIGAQDTGRRNSSAASDQAVPPGDRRHRVVHPKDGIGFATGSYRVDEKALDRWIASLPPDERAALYDPARRVRLHGTASPLGDFTDNMGLTWHRSDSTASALERKGVRATLEVVNEGEERAMLAGKPPQSDDPEDRAVHIVIEPLSPKSEDNRKPEEKPDPTPADDKPTGRSTGVPREYNKFSPNDKSRAEGEELADTKVGVWDVGKRLYKDLVPKKLWRLDQWERKWVKAISKVAALLPFRVGREITDYKRWAQDFRWDDNSPKKFWENRPPEDLMSLKQNDWFKGIVKDNFRKAGYKNPDAMYREWLIYWFRKGVGTDGW